jgi:hypothetical protein
LSACGHSDPVTTAAPTQSASLESSPPAPAELPPGEKPFASVTASINGEPARLDLFKLHRRGVTSLLKFTLTHTGVKPSAKKMHVYSVFQASNFSSPRDTGTVSGITLIDVRNAKIYLTARDSEGNCVCSKMRNTTLDPGEFVLFTATFPAPPAEVLSVDVSIPAFGTVTDLPVD